MGRTLAGSVDPFDYYTSKMEEAIETLSDFARCYDEAGDSEKAFVMLNEEYGGDALGSSFDKDKLQAWQSMYSEVKSLMDNGVTLTESQSHFLEMYNAMMDFFGEDFLSGVDLESNGGEIAGSLGEGIENRLKNYDFTGTGSDVADNLDAAVRSPLGANSPATRFIPIPYTFFTTVRLRRYRRSPTKPSLPRRTRRKRRRKMPLPSSGLTKTSPACPHSSMCFHPG